MDPMEHVDDRYPEQEVGQVATVEGHEPMPGFLTQGDFAPQDRRAQQPEQDEDSHAPPAVLSPLTQDQVTRYIENSESSQAGELIEELTRKATNAQSSGTAPAAQTPFQGSSNRGKAPVRTIRFWFPPVSAPPPSMAAPVPSSPHRAEPSAPH